MTAISNMTIWGNHSATQYPDFYNAKINGKFAHEVITDTEWLKGTFIETVQKRGAAIIKAVVFLQQLQQPTLSLTEFTT